MAKKLSAYNLHMRRALKGKMKGKTKAQRKAIFRAAAKSWKKTKKSSSRSGRSSARRVSRTSTGRRSLTSSRSRSRTTTRKANPVSRKRGFLTTATFMKFARLFALAAPAAAVAMGAGTPQDKIKEGARIYTGFDMNSNQWSLANLVQGWAPFIGTSVVTYGISKIIGMIRRL